MPPPGTVAFTEVSHWRQSLAGRRQAEAPLRPGVKATPSLSHGRPGPAPHAGGRTAARIQSSHDSGRTGPGGSPRPLALAVPTRLDSEPEIMMPAWQPRRQLQLEVAGAGAGLVTPWQSQAVTPAASRVRPAECQWPRTGTRAPGRRPGHDGQSDGGPDSMAVTTLSPPASRHGDPMVVADGHGHGHGHGTSVLVPGPVPGKFTGTGNPDFRNFSDSRHSDPGRGSAAASR